MILFNPRPPEDGRSRPELRTVGPARHHLARRVLSAYGLLRDTENHDGRGVHDADDDPGEPDCRIGEVSPVIGKVPGTPGRFALHNGPRALRVGGS